MEEAKSYIQPDVQPDDQPDDPEKIVIDISEITDVLEKKIETKSNVIEVLKTIPQNLKDFALEQYNVIRYNYGLAKYKLSEKLTFSFSSVDLKIEFDKLKKDIKMGIVKKYADIEIDMQKKYTDMQKAFFVFKHKLGSLAVLTGKTASVVLSTRTPIEYKKNALQELAKASFDTFFYYFDDTTMFVFILLVLLSVFTGGSLLIGASLFNAISSNKNKILNNINI